MLHCASVAVVPRPLALVAGVLPLAAWGAGVAQTQGVVCVLSSTGPPRGALVIVSCVGVALATPAVSVLAPVFSPVTSPVMRPSARLAKALVTSVPLSETER